MPTIRVNECDIYYESHGSGPELLFIHGESHGIEMFEDAISHFSSRYRCVAYYRRGHGKSELPPYGYSLWNNYIDLQELMDRLELRKPVILAVAMSTPLAATYAIYHPDRVRALVLASWYEIAGFPLLEGRRKTQGVSMGAIRMKMEELLKSGGRKALEEWMEANWETRFPIFSPDPVARGKALRMFASHAPGHYVKSAEYYTSLPDLLPQMGGIKCPILGVCGTEDPSPDDPKILAHLDYRQAWIEGARRFTMIEKPAAFNVEVEKFLSELWTP